MFSPELVFLHIPKTAGTSQHRDFNDYIGTEQVFWIGDDCSPDIRSYPRAEIDGKFVVGGHKRLAFFPPDLDPLYCAILRDPVQRAISLFVYYTRPELAAAEHGKEARNVSLQRMLARGIDPDSMLNSIRNCRQFRREISNYQCRYLSRGRATFAAVRKSLRGHDYLVGTVGEYDRFHRELWHLMGRNDATSVQANRSRDNYADSFLQDAELVASIAELNKEDQALVDWVEGRHQGLLQSIRDPDERRQRLQRLPQRPDIRMLRRLKWEDASNLWPSRGALKLQWPISRMMVAEQHRLIYMPTSGALDKAIQHMMLDLSSVEHKDALRKFGIDRVVTEFVTGLMLEDRTAEGIRAIAASEAYHKFAIIYEPVTRLVDIYQQRFIEKRDTLSHWPRLCELVADAQGLEVPDFELGVTFRQFVRAVASGKHDHRLWLPQIRYLPWSNNYNRFYRADQLAELERDLDRLRGLSVTIDATSFAPVARTGEATAEHADTPPAQLPTDPAHWRDQLVDDAVYSMIEDYYASDFSLYNSLIDKDLEEACQ